jgi:hypothetical protein
MVRQGKPNGVGNKAGKDKGCKHAEENEEVGKHKNVSLGKTIIGEGNPERRKRITITKAALSRSSRNPMGSIKIVHAESMLEFITFAIGGIASHKHAIRFKTFMENVDKHDR